jgi:hypothetical protein
MEQLIADIKRNCDISDAAFWGHFSICGLLMRYRDLFRSERRLAPWDPIPREDIARWIGNKEARWPELENRPFVPLAIDGRRVEPFDSDAVNGWLGRRRLAYGAGYGAFLKPTFLLAEVNSAAHVEGHVVYTTGREIVRDLFTSPAMLQERTIFIRREPLLALLWDLFTQLRPGCAADTAGAFALFGLTPGRPAGPGVAEPLGRMADAFADVLLRHELAESREALPAWKHVLAAGLDRRAELFLRAVQDLIADTSDAGPLSQCVRDRDGRAFSLAVGLMERYRLSLVPELRSAFRRFREQEDWHAVDEVRRSLLERFRKVRQAAVELYEPGDPASFSRRLQTLMPDRP